MALIVTIEKDKHSLYIKFNGFVYRPIGTKNQPDIETIFDKGSKVEVTKPFDQRDGTVAIWYQDELYEHWYNHGWYLKILKNKQRIVAREIDLCWKPTRWWDRIIYRSNNFAPSAGIH